MGFNIFYINHNAIIKLSIRWVFDKLGGADENLLITNIMTAEIYQLPLDLLFFLDQFIASRFFCNLLQREQRPTSYNSQNPVDSSLNLKLLKNLR